jgi:hypothetical protein
VVAQMVTVVGSVTRVVCSVRPVVHGGWCCGSSLVIHKRYEEVFDVEKQSSRKPHTEAAATGASDVMDLEADSGALTWFGLGRYDMAA